MSLLNAQCVKALAQDLAGEGFPDTASVPAGHRLRAELDELTSLERDRVDHFLAGYLFGGGAATPAGPDPVVPRCYYAGAEIDRLRGQNSLLWLGCAVLFCLLMVQVTIGVARQANDVDRAALAGGPR